MRYKAIVSYDGTSYAGWQTQNDQPSIQQCLNQALSKITNTDMKVTGAGRTDGKVHAKGQVFHFDTDKSFKDLKQAINSQLPEDIYVVDCQQVDEDFHARFSARWKHYDYLINNGQYDPLLRNYTAYIARPLNLQAIKQAAKVFEGTHDFTSFNATKKEEISDQVRTVYKIDIVEEKGIIKLSFYGDGFLRYMVRMLSQTLIEAGLGKVTTEEITRMLSAKDKQACHYNGQPQGLYLIEVGYDAYNMH